MSAPTNPALAVRKPILYGDATHWGLVEADTLLLLPQLPDGCIDAVVCDPPYNLSFGGAAWDGRDIRDAVGAASDRLSDGEAFERWTERWASECRRLLRPGGYLVAFGAPRTFHRLVAGVEDAGLEIRDVISWLYGSGMPKSRRLRGDRGTALKPAIEPLVVARKALDGSTEDNVARHGTGVLNIGEGRVHDDTYHDAAGQLIGRWPANVAWSHHPACRSARCHPVCPKPLLDQGQKNAPSRFFYSSKASTSEREAGCEQLPKRAAAVFSTKKGTPVARRGNHHPTPKPIDLMRWLTRLVCPAGGVVLDPFAGSGSGGAAAMLEGRGYLGIEREPEFARIAVARIGHWASEAAPPEDRS